MPAEQVGIVYLVGAGPGDPGLITVKCLELVKRADAIVYDSLIPRSILNNARLEAELIYVGKSAGKHTKPQEEINDLLCRLGNEGKTVVRLKGGDPFVFGRGGEEALALKQAGVPFEVVPGITAGLAAPLYAGIPVSHRGIATNIHLITGHEDPTKSDSQLDFELLAKVNGTLVFYMGVANLPEITRELMGHGKAPNTPAAVIHRGCTPHQRVVTGRLDDIAGISSNAGITPPAVIVIGDVVALRPEISWFEKAPLFGKSVVVTRARAQTSSLSERLAALGADVIELPTIAIEPVELSKEDEAALLDIARYDWMFFTSPNAVASYFQVLHDHQLDARSLAAVKIASIGPATSDVLRMRGIIPDLVPGLYTSQDLLAAFKQRADSLHARSALLPRADIASSTLADGLRSMNIPVTEIDIYRTVAVEPDNQLIDRIRNAPIDYVTFASSSAVQNFKNVLGNEKFLELSKLSRFVSIGPVTSARIRELGANVAAQAEVSDIDGLVEALVRDTLENV